MQTIFAQFILLFLFWAVGVLIILLLAGLIGPLWLKEKMRRQVRWYWRDASPFMPMDPYKPPSEALKEGFNNFWPTKQRIRNNLLIALGQFLMFFGILALGLILYILWQSH